MINRALNQKTAWSDERAIAVSSLIEAAVASRAESFSLIPRVDGRETEDGLRQWILRETMREILQMLEGRNVLALIEPIGFASSSLKHKAELVDAIEAVGGRTKFKLVHATFQHVIVGGGPIFPDYTATVHISGISDPLPTLDERLDAHRGLVDRDDRCGTIDQIAGFIEAGTRDRSLLNVRVLPFKTATRWETTYVSHSTLSTICRLQDECSGIRPQCDVPSRT